MTAPARSGQSDDHRPLAGQRAVDDLRTVRGANFAASPTSSCRVLTWLDSDLRSLERVDLMAQVVGDRPVQRGGARRRCPAPAPGRRRRWRRGDSGKRSREQSLNPVEESVPLIAEKVEIGAAGLGHGQRRADRDEGGEHEQQQAPPRRSGCDRAGSRPWRRRACRRAAAGSGTSTPCRRGPCPGTRRGWRACRPRRSGRRPSRRRAASRCPRWCRSAGKVTALDAEVLHPGQAGRPAVRVGVHDDLGAAAQHVVGHRVHVADDHVRRVARLDAARRLRRRRRSAPACTRGCRGAARRGRPCSRSRAPRSRHVPALELRVARRAHRHRRGAARARCFMYSMVLAANASSCVDRPTSASAIRSAIESAS